MSKSLLDDQLLEFIENRYDLQVGITISDKQHRIVVVFVDLNH